MEHKKTDKEQVCLPCSSATREKSHELYKTFCRNSEVGTGLHGAWKDRQEERALLEATREKNP